MTALHIAVIKNDYIASTTLISSGASKLILDTKGETALIKARKAGSIDCAKIIENYNYI